jgi:gamma-glutamyltranspeptidase / glutathione hydrolase
MSNKYTCISCFSILISVFIHAQQAPVEKNLGAYKYSIQKKITCSNGAVVSAHPLASRAGVIALKKGGNAVDAAIATQLALAVVYPAAGNIGGGGFMVARMNNGKSIALDYREKAPAAASRDMYLDKDGNPQMNLSQHGHLAAGIPGTIAGLFASMKYAKLPFKTLIEPAIVLAEKGFAITENEANSLNAYKEAFIKYNTMPPAFVKELPWQIGDTLIQTDLANTLKRIRDNGAAGFYEGETARLIIEEIQRGKGLITLEDLKNYTAKERTPLSFPYKKYTVITMPLPSSGGIIINQTMKMVEQRNIAKMGFLSAECVQLMVEAERRAFADRAEFMGDADFVKVPVKKLTSTAYIEDRLKDYQPNKAGSSQVTKAGSINPESEETTHLSVVDKWGNAVSVTTTLNGGYGSKTVVGGAGFILNNEMDDFSVKPGVPNMYGAVGTEANAIAPGKRMLSSMTPTIVLKNNQPYIVAGTPGGTTIPTSVYQTLVNILEFNLSAEDAVNKPKFHHQWLPDEVFVEKDFPAVVVEQLKTMGYKISMRGAIGRTEVIKIMPGKKPTQFIIEAVGDKRGDDAAEGFTPVP